MQNNNNIVQQHHKFGLRGLIFTYSWKSFSRGLRIALPITVLLFILVLKYSTKSTTDIIADYSGIALSILPNLLGFLLGGYTILISFGNSNILMQLVSVQANGVSIYQTLSSTFAFCLFLQASSLLFDTTVQLILKLQIYYSCAALVNYCGIFMVVFTLIYSICTLLDIIVNVFSFSQYHHWKLLEEKRNATRAGNNSNNPQSGNP